MTAATPRERMLRLLSLLQTGRRWAAGELAAALGAPPRTLRRDIEQLRALGYPVESVRGPGGYYRLVAGAALPPLMLEDDEAIATALGLRLAAAGGTEAADRAAAKLRRVLPAPLRRRTDELLAAVEVGAPGHPQPSPETLGDLAAAIAARRRVVLDHSGPRGSSRRTVDPFRLVRLRQRWYLFGWDLDRRDWRTFRLDRIAGPRPTGDVFPPRDLPADDLAEHLRRRFRAPSAHQVVLVLHADARDAAARLHRVDGTLHPLDDGRCRYTADVDSYEWLATVLVLTDLEFTVEEPAGFAGYLAATAERLLRGAGRVPPAGG